MVVLSMRHALKNVCAADDRVDEEFDDALSAAFEQVVNLGMLLGPFLPGAQGMCSDALLEVFHKLVMGMQAQLLRKSLQGLHHCQT